MDYSDASTFSTASGKDYQYVVLQVTLKEKFIGTGSGNLTELENAIKHKKAIAFIPSPHQMAAVKVLWVEIESRLLWFLKKLYKTTIPGSKSIIFRGSPLVCLVKITVPLSRLGRLFFCLFRLLQDI